MNYTLLNQKAIGDGPDEVFLFFKFLFAPDFNIFPQIFALDAALNTRISKYPILLPEKKGCLTRNVLSLTKLLKPRNSYSGLTSLINNSRRAYRLLSFSFS